MSSGGLHESSILCFKCHETVCTLTSVRLVKMDANDTPLVVKLSKLSDSVQQRHPHPDGERIKYKKGKLTCACGTNLGNIQDNVPVAPYGKGIEVGLLKFQNLRFSLVATLAIKVPAAQLATRAFKVPAARVLRAHVFPSPATRKAYEVTPNHIFDASDESTELRPEHKATSISEIGTASGQPTGNTSLLQRSGNASAVARNESKNHDEDLMQSAQTSSALSAGADCEQLPCPGRNSMRKSLTSSSLDGNAQNDQALRVGLPVRPSAKACAFFMKTGTCKYGKICKWHHPPEKQAVRGMAAVMKMKSGAVEGAGDRSMVAMGGLPGALAASTSPMTNNSVTELQLPRNDHLRRLFDKCTKTKAFDFRGVQQALMFARSVEAYSEDDLPWRLTKRDEFGVKRLSQAVHVGGVQALIPIIRALAQPKWKVPKFDIALDICTRELFNTAGILENLLHSIQAKEIQAACDLTAISEFGMMVAFAVPDVLNDHSDLLGNFSQTLLDTCEGDMETKAAFRGAERLQQLTAGAKSATEQMQQVAREGVAAMNKRVEGFRDGPGGRHSNDCVNFREISITPTMDELLAAQMPFLPTAPRPDVRGFLADDPETQLLDRHFRLLREDFIASVREQQAQERGFSAIFEVRVAGVELHAFEVRSLPGDAGNEVKYRRGPIGLKLTLLKDRSAQQERDLVKILCRRRQLQNGSLVLLRTSEDSEPVAIGRVVSALREPDELNQNTAREIGIDFAQAELAHLITERRTLQLVGMTGTFFAYEPVLKCLQKLRTLPFREEILGELEESPAPDYPGIENVLGNLEQRMQDRGIELDVAQQAAFQHACSHRVALIVGPPGTGKSFVGAELASSILRSTTENLLVVCYTNHALDQFLCHMLDKQEQHIVRIGGKSREPRLDQYTLFNLTKHSNRAQGREEKSHLWSLYGALEVRRKHIEEAVKKLQESRMNWHELKHFLQVEDPDSLEQLEWQQPDDQDGFLIADGKGGIIQEDYLYRRWLSGEDPTPFSTFSDRQLWKLDPAQRVDLNKQWLTSFQREAKNALIAAKQDYDRFDSELTSLKNVQERAVLQRARVIGATTTGAAKYRELLEVSKPGVLIIEEAGEVLEAHVLSSLVSNIKHVIMIGDHKQLRPKVDTHSLTVDAKQGHDLNLSLFERLIGAGLAHKTLEMQHRMRPDISSIARHMTYPYLRNHPSVEGRDAVRGLATNVVFVNHTHPEKQASEDDSLSCKTLSKVNEFEAAMSVEIVHFLLLQGYEPHQIVILVPYLGQLKVISDLLNAQEIITSLDERDAEDLLSLKVDQPWSLPGQSARHIRISTIDNYQGEEADLVVASLVRSNSKGRIGFLGRADAEQRVNVLCTRARLGLILIGNAACFRHSSPPAPLWPKLLDFLHRHGAIFDGLPIKCQKHQSQPEPSEVCCPELLRARCKDGAGCGRRCDALLPCGHPCPLKCHPWSHDAVKCARVIRQTCPANLHRIEVPCSFKGVPYCSEAVIEKCPSGHPVVRKCGDVVLGLCMVCQVLQNAESESKKLDVARINEETSLLASYAEKAAQNQGDEEDLRGEAKAELNKLHQLYEETRRKQEKEQGDRIDAALENAQEAVRAALKELNAKFELDEQRLEARRADTEQNLQRIAARMEQQRIDARQAELDQIREQDEALHRLHAALKASLKEDEHNIMEACRGRPDPEMIKHQLDDLRLKTKTVSCGICMEELTLLDGVLCRCDGHFICNHCFTGHVKEEATKSTFNGDVYCPYTSPAMGGCDSPAYLGCVVARHASDEAFAALEFGRLVLRERLNNEKMQREFDARLEAEKMKMAALAECEIAASRKHIVDKILTLSCPRCGQAFVDFDGCCALTCSRQGCGCAFCAFCLEDCGADAHAHVAKCGEKVFMEFKEVQSKQRDHKRRKILLYLSEHKLREKIVMACEQELRENNLWPLWS